MRVEDWKNELNERCARVVQEYTEMFAHINAMDDIDTEGLDVDELGVYVHVKLLTMNKKITELEL